MRLTGRALVVAMCAGQAGNLLPHVAVPAVMAQHLVPAWGLSATEAGLMASAFAIGYVLAVPILTGLTDRIDARLVLLAGSALCGAATFAFGLFAHGLWSALAIWAVAGVGFAGAYMPGLKALVDRLPPGDASRSITLYTATYSIGVGLSFLVAQVAADGLGWRFAFYITALGPLAMVAACLCMAPVAPVRSTRRLLDFKPVFRNRAAMGFILGYGAHCFELYALRTWIVAFWTFVAARSGGAALLQPIAVSVITALLAMPSSIMGNEAAIRFGRHRAIMLFMGLAGVMALLIGATAGFAAPALLLALLFVYAIAIPADSGALTSGMTLSAEPEYRGATMAMHSTVGFGLSAVGAWALGVALDAGGGMQSAAGWRIAFAVMAAGGLMGPLALWWSRRQSKIVSDRSAKPFDRGT
jgi:MFS family permease